MDLEQKIEGVLFYLAGPVEKSALLKLFSVSEEDLATSLSKLQSRLEKGALSLIISDSEVELVTKPELDELIDNLRKDEMKRDIGKAGAETLAIVLYRGPVTRSEIDRIRGVNSSYILRNLEIRGLVERGSNARRSEFKATTELLKHLGIRQKTELRDYATVMGALENYEAEQKLDEE